MIDLAHKNAFITGSSRGVGQQIAKGLAELGCNVIIHGRTQKSCDQTLQLLQKYKVQVYVVYGALEDEKQLNSLIDQVQQLPIKVDILYNNAALMTPRHDAYYTHPWETWELSMKVNVYALYRLCGAFIPDMIANGFGRVVNLTSGIKNQPELAPYGASKWAVNKLTDDLAFKLKDTPVRINTLDPGWLRTDMGGPFGEHSVEAVLPGALVPVLIDDDGANGQFFAAIDYKIT